MVLATETTSEGGSFLVAPSAGTVAVAVFLIAALVFVVWFVAYLLRTPPRFLRLALGFCNVAVGIVALSVLFGVYTTAFGSDSVSVGGPVAVGHGGVQATIPINTSWGRPEDKDYERQVAGAYGKGAEIPDGQEVHVAVGRPSAGLWVLSISSALFSAGFAIAWLLVLRGILDRAELGQPFHEANARGLRRLALLTVAGGIVVPIVHHIAMAAVVHEAGGTESIGWGLSIFTPVAVGVLLLALSEVWRYGIELQHDAEATV